MKKPNKLYRKLGGKRSTAGAAFAAVRHPVRSLRQSFGRDKVAMDAAEGIEGEFTKNKFWQVLNILEKWKKNYNGPKLSGIFRMWTTPQPRKIINAPKPEME